MRNLFVGVAAILGMTAAAPMADAQTLKMMKSLDAPHYDGQRTTWSPTSDIVNMFQDTLVAMDWDGKTPIPYLAKSWTVSPDGKLYTFKLRDDVSFCSGKKFTADDVVYSFKRLTSPELKAPLAWRAGSLKEIRATDPYTRRVRAERALRRPAAQPHHVHDGDPQQGERRVAGQGLRHQGGRRHRAVVLRIVAAAHRDRAEAPRRLQVGPLDVPEQGPGEVREALDQDRARGREPRRRHDGRAVRRHPPDPAAVHLAGQGLAQPQRPGGDAQLPADVLRLQDDAGRWWPTSACARR